MITTYDIRERCLRVFESWKKETIFKTKDLLLATSAAPTYFAPRRIYPVNVKDHYGYELSDGGTCLNNPSAYITMLAKKNIKMFGGFEIVSLGTGTCLDPLNFNTMKSAGIFKWAPKLVDVFMDGQSSVADEMMSHLFPNDYYHYNPILPRANLRLDDSSSANLSYLIAATDQMIKMNKKSIAELVQELRTPKMIFF